LLATLVVVVLVVVAVEIAGGRETTIGIDSEDGSTLK
jgi:hypothetical protein